MFLQVGACGVSVLLSVDADTLLFLTEVGASVTLGHDQSSAGLISWELVKVGRWSPFGGAHSFDTLKGLADGVNLDWLLVEVLSLVGSAP